MEAHFKQSLYCTFIFIFYPKVLWIVEPARPLGLGV